MTDEEAKKVILARRARFIAAALASAGLAAASCGSDDNRPQACLSPPRMDSGAGQDVDAAPDADSGPEGLG